MGLRGATSCRGATPLGSPWAGSGATTALMAIRTVPNEFVAHRALAGLGMRWVLAGWLVG